MERRTLSRFNLANLRPILPLEQRNAAWILRGFVETHVSVLKLANIQSLLLYSTSLEDLEQDLARCYTSV